MLCQQCKQQTATIHLTEINNGVRVETHLCEFCAEQEGIAIKSQVPLNELLSTLLASQETEKIEPEEDKNIGEKTECPSCGMTVQAFRKGGLLGCPNDYDAFNETLEPMIEKSQGGNSKHVGKVPKNEPEDSKKHIEVINLRKQLEEAVRGEDYEKAAELRDRINNLQ